MSAYEPSARSPHARVPNPLRILPGALALAALFACGGGDGADQPPTQSVAATADSPIRFEALPPARTGVGFVSRVEETPYRNYFLFNYIYIGGGVAVADFDGDGREDLYLVSQVDSSRLYLNRGDFRFEDVTVASGAALPGLTKTGVTVVDVNQDGHPDLYQCVTGELDGDRRNRLLVNQGDGTFREDATSYGLALDNPSTAASFFDYDGDGDLDVYVINRPVDYKTNTQVRVTEVDGRRVRNPLPADELESDRLLRNDGGRFVDVSAVAGIRNRAFSLAVATTDLTGDGLPDVYVANDYIEPDHLYVNRGDGTFADEALARFGHMPHSSMGTDFGDLDGDGLPELMTVDMLADGHERQLTNETAMRLKRHRTLEEFGYGSQIARNMLQSARGDGSYGELACMAGMYKTDWSWGPLFFDADNDGRSDVFVSNGFLRDVGDMDFNAYTYDSLRRLKGLRQEDLLTALELMPSRPQPDYLFRNRGDFRFDDVTAAAGMGEPTFSNGAAYADLDGDGRLDLVVHHNDAPVGVYANRGPKTGESLTLVLTGSPPNLDATGARAVVTLADGTSLTREQQPTRGFFSSQSTRLHFGLGPGGSQAATLEVFWPDGAYSSQAVPPGGGRLELARADAQSRVPDGAAGGEEPVPELFAEARPAGFAHAENAFSHFDQSPLLYRELSAEGPALAVADVNGDGRDDAFVGGASGQASRVGLQAANGALVWSDASFAAAAESEDVAAHFFDADADGDLDLYVGSAGVAPAGRLLRDRLYVNDGAGAFAEAEGALPQNLWVHTSALVSLDADGDGDLDLAVAHHGDPRNFPTDEPNALLINDGVGRFSAAADPGGAWRDAGMLTDLAVADLDGDGAPELVAAGEWEPVTAYKGTEGRLQPAAGIEMPRVRGLWFALEAADLDGDGDVDLAAGNLGLNTRFEAAADKPLTLAGYDLDGNGRRDPVVFGYKGTDRSLPYARREALAKQVPSIAKAYPRFAAYARADQAELLRGRDPAELRTAEQLASGVFVNEGGGAFRFVELPRAAQVSAVRDFAVLPTAEGPRLLVAGNLYESEILSGPLDASSGVVLRLSADGTLRSAPSRETGFWAKGNVRGVGLLRRDGQAATAIVTRSGDEATLLPVR